MENGYHIPAVRLGDVVLWYPGGEIDQEPHVGIVVGVGNDNICINTFSQHDRVMYLHDGVRHVCDPRARSDDLREAGGWESRDEYYNRVGPVKSEKVLPRRDTIPK